ncbi:MAG: hypothetical protein QOI57_2314 [Rubrobacteraceae bacterium]|jgi:hypothetical protein|nr:hypothetical protein [Rubrobacteraceae bacterium]
MSERGFFSRILGGGADEDNTRIFSDEEIERSHRRRSEPEEEQRPQGFTVERASEIIDDLPPEVPRESAVRIVRGTLVAAGIRVDDLDRSTRAREAKLNSEIDLARNRQEELRQRTEELVRSLEQEIKRAREDRDTGVAEEEERISRASSRIEGIKRVRVFFGFLDPEEEEEIPGPAEDASVDETQVLKPFDTDETQVLRRSGQLADADEPTDAATSERLSRYRDSHGTHDQH